MDQALTDLDGLLHIEDIVTSRLEDDRAYILDLGKYLQRWYESHQLTVVWIIVPGDDWNPILWLELVAVR